MSDKIDNREVIIDEIDKIKSSLHYIRDSVVPVGTKVTTKTMLKTCPADIENIERSLRRIEGMIDSRREVTEDDKDIIDSWFEQARTVTIKSLPEFMETVLGGYRHDYGTICHAIAACAVAASWAANGHPSGGITGFQATAVFWEFYRRWMSEEGPARLVKYDDMLYPQYERNFEKAISPSVWEWIQERAQERLDAVGEIANSKAVDHWKSIVDGEVPFGYTVDDDVI